MSFSYTLPAASDRDKVRFLIADTVEDGYRVENEEIDFCLSESGSDSFFAAALCCDALSAQYSAKGRVSVGSLTVDHAQMSTDYSNRAKQLRDLAYNRPGTFGGPYVGGISQSDKDSNSDDPDWARTVVSVGFTDFRGTVYVDDRTWQTSF